MADHDVVIVSAKRTPIGAFQGALAPATATQLGSAAIRAAVESAGIKAADIQEVLMGNVLSARPRTRPGAAGSARGRRTGGHSDGHHQQAVRLRAQGCDDGVRPDPHR